MPTGSGGKAKETGRPFTWPWEDEKRLPLFPKAKSDEEGRGVVGRCGVKCKICMNFNVKPETSRKLSCLRMLTLGVLLCLWVYFGGKV